MNILLTFDNNYCQHAAVVLTSLCMNNINETISVYVISDYISNENKNKLFEVLKTYNATIQYIIIDKSLTKNLPFGKETSNNYITNIATYYRIFITELLPKTIGRILYLDCDIVINDSIKPLWNWKFSLDACIAVVEEMPAIVKESTYRLNYPFSYSYFNAGIILFDLDKLREIYTINDAFEYIQTHRNSIKYHDQDILNAILYKNKDFLPIKYNLMEGFLYKLNANWERCKKYKDDLFNPAIIHYAGPLKPWYSECNHPYKQLYYYYLNKTSWNDYEPQFKYNTIKSKCIHALKSVIKLMLDYMHIRAYQFRKDLPNIENLLHNEQ